VCAWDSRRNHVEQFALIQWLGQIAHCAGGKDTFSGFWLVFAGDDDAREAISISPETALNVHARESREVQVKNRAIRSTDFQRVKKILS
jgi:hypothetical protein